MTGGRFDFSSSRESWGSSGHKKAKFNQQGDINTLIIWLYTLTDLYALLLPNTTIVISVQNSDWDTKDSQSTVL